MSEILEGSLDPRIAPRGILPGHAHDQVSDLGQHAAAVGSLPRIAIQLRIVRAIDLAHPAGADWREDLVGAETSADRQGHERRRISRMIPPDEGWVGQGTPRVPR